MFTHSEGAGGSQVLFRLTQSTYKSSKQNQILIQFSENFQLINNYAYRCKNAPIW